MEAVEKMISLAWVIRVLAQLPLTSDTLSIYQIFCKSDNIPKCSENDSHLKNAKNSSSVELAWLREVQGQGSWPSSIT